MNRVERFRTVVAVDRRGRTQVPIPFDPDQVWGAKPRHPVRGSVAGRFLRDRGGVVGMAELGEVTGVDVAALPIPTWMAAWAEAVRDENVRTVAAPRMLQIRHRVGDLVAQLQKEGRWDPAADPQLVGQAALGLIPGFILQRLIIGDVDPEGYGRAVAGLLQGQREPVATSDQAAGRAADQPPGRGRPVGPRR